jgi:hypothetical protein
MPVLPWAVRRRGGDTRAERRVIDTMSRPSDAGPRVARLATATPAAPGTPAPAGPAGPGRSPARADPLAGALRGAVARRAGAAPVVQRKLDEDFAHGGTPKKGETAACHAFAKKVSAIVDEVYLDLVSGNVAAWKGAKIATFLRLLLAEKRAALVHVGNAIEERVYAVMKARDLGEEWVAQFDANMGGASFPDVVVHLGSGARGLIDVTSDRGHILRKAGGWCTSVHYIYVAEAWFPSVFLEHLDTIRENVVAGGVDSKQVEKLITEANTARSARQAERERVLREAREEYAQYSSYAAFVREAFEGNRGEANAWMRAHGMGGYKGVATRRSRRTMTYEQKARKRKQAEKVRRAKQTPEERRAEEKRKKRMAEKRRQHKTRQEKFAENRRKKHRQREDEELVMDVGGEERESDEDSGDEDGGAGVVLDLTGDDETPFVFDT